MLSILIPIYNYDIRPLVYGLQSEASQLDLEWEILCYDDGSDEQWKATNRDLKAFPHIYYLELAKNIGRSAIRNKLAQDARGSYLLFLDNDSGLVGDQFLGNYIQYFPTKAVLYGGRIYKSETPAQKRQMLHWTFGYKRESLTLDQREEAPYESFMTNNFCLRRELYLEIGLDERIKTYGHEDTLFGLSLKENKIEIRHIDNPVIHLGLEDQESFLSKQKEAIENLTQLQLHYPSFSTRLTRTVELLKRWHLLAFAKWVLQFLMPGINRNLRGPQPNMRYLDLWKLYHLLKRSSVSN